MPDRRRHLQRTRELVFLTELIAVRARSELEIARAEATKTQQTLRDITAASSISDLGLEAAAIAELWREYAQIMRAQTNASLLKQKIVVEEKALALKQAQRKKLAAELLLKSTV